MVEFSLDTCCIFRPWPTVQLAQVYSNFLYTLVGRRFNHSNDIPFNTLFFFNLLALHVFDPFKPLLLTQTQTQTRQNLYIYQEMPLMIVCFSGKFLIVSRGNDIIIIMRNL